MAADRLIVNGHYEVDPTRALSDYDTPTATAYAVFSPGGKDPSMFGLLCDPKMGNRLWQPLADRADAAANRQLLGQLGKIFTLLGAFDHRQCLLFGLDKNMTGTHFIARRGIL